MTHNTSSPYLPPSSGAVTLCPTVRDTSTTADAACCTIAAAADAVRDDCEGMSGRMGSRAPGRGPRESTADTIRGRVVPRRLFLTYERAAERDDEEEDGAGEESRCAEDTDKEDAAGESDARAAKMPAMPRVGRGGRGNRWQLPLIQRHC